MQPPVSVIVNTVDRVEALGNLLRGLTQVRYPDFEVIVVAGPSQDATDELLEEWADRVRVERCPIRNLSVSRNIGVRAAATDFVAFIDDDAVPEPAWLTELMAGFDSDEVAAVGGWVYDHTGHSFQCTHTGADRLGNARPDHPEPLDDLCVPGAWRFPYAPGGNGVYRRETLMAVGGFDEEFEYYLEETDLCLRLIDHGWVVRQVDGGAIHHKFLSSSRRSVDRVLRDRYAVVKNKVYFSIVNAADDVPITQVMSDNVAFAEIHRADAKWHLHNGTATAEDVEESLSSIERGWHAGLAAGLRGRTRLGFLEPLTLDRSQYIPFPTIALDEPLRIVFVSQTIPPTVIGGIGRYFLDLAGELAARGHEVRVVTTGTGHPTVDLENGVWIHRIPKEADDDLMVGQIAVPSRIAANANAVADEVERIAATNGIDLVYAAMWDVEHLAVMERSLAPVVTALVTTFGITLRTRPEWAEDAEFMAHLGTPLLALERWVLDRSDGLHAISDAIVHDVELTAGPIDVDRTVVAPIGEEDRFADQIAGPGDGDGGCTFLFVGRFEKRKGIDLLLGALPDLLGSHPLVRVRLIGRTDLPGESGTPYWQEFIETHGDSPWFDRVELLGEVPDEVLAEALATSDVLVAPSRFESFGLVYLEGMMAGLPVVAVREGAATEVLVDDEVALLVDADSGELGSALARLAQDPELRARLGAGGRRRFKDRYTAECMADRVERILDAVATRRTSRG